MSQYKFAAVFSVVLLLCVAAVTLVPKVDAAAEGKITGTIKLDGSTLTDSSGLTIGSGATLSGFGAGPALSLRRGR